MYHKIEVEALKAFHELKRKYITFFAFNHQDVSLTSFSSPRYNIFRIKLAKDMEYCPKVVASDEILSCTVVDAFLSPKVCRLDRYTCTQRALTNCCAVLMAHGVALVLHYSFNVFSM